MRHAAGPAGCLSRKGESEWGLRRWLNAEEHVLLLLRTHDRSDDLSGLHRSLALDTHMIFIHTHKIYIKKLNEPQVGSLVPKVGFWSRQENGSLNAQTLDEHP